MEEFALIKLRVKLNRVYLGIALISDLKVTRQSINNLERDSVKREAKYKLCSLQANINFSLVSKIKAK